MFLPRAKVTALWVAVCLSASAVVQASAPNEYDSAQMVPYANFTAAGNITAVGVLARQSGSVYWAFFDGDGNRRAHNSFSILANELHPFIWNSQTAGASLADVEGFLLFAIDTNGDGQITNADGSDNLGANAFYIVPPDDVAYIPTIDVDDSELINPLPANWTVPPVTGLPDKFAETGDTVDIQYLIDGASGGDDTAIIIWTTRQMASSQSMALHDGDGTSKAINTPFLQDNLNVIDLEADNEVTSAFFGEGYVRWAIPDGGDGSSVDVFLFSMVSSPTFGAIQTLLPNFYD